MLRPFDAPLNILSTNDVLTDLVFDRAPTWETKGWISVPLATHMKPLLNRLRQRCAATTFGRIAGDGAWQTLERARQDASMTPPRDFTMAVMPSQDPDTRFELTGARLNALTQALAYRGILEHRQVETRRRTKDNLAAVYQHLQANNSLTFGQIWMSTRHKDFSRIFAVFLWKIMHDGLKCGPYWSKIQGYEDRAQCSHCGSLETVQHIIFECEATGQALIWSLIRKVWEKKLVDVPWPRLSLVDVLSLGLTEWKTSKGRVRPGATRLWRILISEAVHLTWKLRCERVIGHAAEDGWEHQKTTVASKLRYALNHRLALDVESVQKKYGQFAIKRELVLATWNKVLWDEHALPEDWTKYKGFLVGRMPALRVDLEPD
ncbi:uncharacterized protein B0H18DRAFT_881518 [Fomitopsis serialis]|uniref:uncharacterized protein n=1 Tax=Fomitopsis serialis TaxID=139415 RepID=UPI002007DBC0|nr:uncharacterized protein B0H18DRAFT_881518 [Neoantrodia serialis]KAH9919937.1 hypothetical protein B0H18DRAFT_881518 [Neoantrodia serialis]